MVARDPFRILIPNAMAETKTHTRKRQEYVGANSTCHEDSHARASGFDGMELIGEELITFAWQFFLISL